MLEIKKPNLEIVELDEDYGKFILQPLERGFAITIGNSLRRVLLSSLPGAAATGVKIDSVLHEFSTIEGVTEDVVDIILNIKDLAIKMQGDDDVILTLRSHGEGELTGADISCPAGVQIVNPELHIATLSNSAKIDMDIYVDRGRGYISAEKNKEKDFPINVIPIDSLYSPVKKVNYSYEQMPGQESDELESLTIEVWTNKAINAKEAISLASRVLVEHLNMFIDLTEDAINIEVMAEKESKEEESTQDMTIEDLDFSVRSYNCLKRAGINTLGELLQKSEADLMKVRNLGRKSLEEVNEKLDTMGYTLREEE